MPRSSTPLFLSLMVTAARADIAKNCMSPDLCFGLNIPDATVSSGTGDLYLQVSGPTTYSWIAVAQGEQMAGAHYFVVYTSEDGNSVTVSPRLADGHSPPEFSPDTQFEVLEGTGVNDGLMTANIRCSNCDSWANGSMNLTSESTNWIWAHAVGSPLNTNDLSARIQMHDLYGSITFDTASHGSGNNPVNPFLTTPSSDDNNTITTESHTSHSPPHRIIVLYTTHAVLASLAWLLIFPLGGILIRLLSHSRLLYLHSLVQLLGLLLYTASVALGIILSINPRYYRMNNPHVVIGLLLFALFWCVQPLSGWMHHVAFKKNGGKRGVWSWVHLWGGRVAITLAVVNGGLGFRITRKGWETWEVKVYTVFAVVCWGIYVGCAVLGEVRKAKKEKDVGPEVDLVETGESPGASGQGTPVTREVIGEKVGA